MKMRKNGNRLRQMKGETSLDMIIFLGYWRQYIGNVHLWGGLNVVQMDPFTKYKIRVLHDG